QSTLSATIRNYLNSYGVTPVLPSSPTRRSSDLDAPQRQHDERIRCAAPDPLRFRQHYSPFSIALIARASDDAGLRTRARGCHDRSEEHTSELQSRENLVCRLLLEKKTKKLMQYI